MSVIDEHLDYSQSVGWSTRVRECDNCVGMGNSKAVQLTRKEDGFLWHCFRCSKSGFFRDSAASPTQVKTLVANMNKQKPDNRPEVVTLPPAADWFNPQGLVDLYDHFIEPDDIDRFDIYWSADHQRIMFPFYKYITNGLELGKKLVGWSGKKLSTDDNKDKPKWHTVRQRDVTHPRFIAPPFDRSLHPNRVVLVEDPISAIRVSQQGVASIGLMTTYLPYELYPVLRRFEVVVWLDDDAYDKSCKYFAKLNSNGVQAHIIHTKRDPKLLSPEEMREKLPWQNLK